VVDLLGTALPAESVAPEELLVLSEGGCLTVAGGLQWLAAVVRRSSFRSSSTASSSVVLEGSTDAPLTDLHGVDTKVVNAAQSLEQAANPLLYGISLIVTSGI
jgi:organic hydroperoxide reductase OsmC/OhrA